MVGKGLTSKSQFHNDFRKKRSTLDELSSFVSDIHLCFSDNKYRLVVNVNLKDDYDQVNVTLLISKTLKICLDKFSSTFPPVLCIKIRCKGRTCGPREKHMGLPHGVALTPLLRIKNSFCRS